MCCYYHVGRENWENQEKEQDAERTWWRLPTPPAFEPSPMPPTLHVKSPTASRTAEPCSNTLYLLLRRARPSPELPPHITVLH